MDDRESFHSARTTAALRLIRREKLTPAQREAFRALAAPHAAEVDGSVGYWEQTPSNVEVIWNDDRSAPVGVLIWSGRDAVDVGVWTAEQGLGYARRAAELLAKQLVAEAIPAIKLLPVLPGHRIAAGRFVRHLRAEFEREWQRVERQAQREGLI
jgi:hypothetical protein